MSVRQAPLASDVFNVKDFGAVGDGKQDDTQFIQKAINAAYNGGVVYFPFGVYNISSPLIVNADSVSLIGDGQRTSAPTIQISPSADPTYALIVGNTKNANSCLISGIQFMGRNNTTSTGKGILFRSNGGKIFQTRIIYFGGNGVVVDSFSGTIFEVFFEDVDIYTNGMNATTHGDGLTISGLASDCEYHRVLIGGDPTKTSTHDGFVINGAGNQKFVDCHAYFCSHDGFFVSSGVGCQILGGEFETNTVNGIESSGVNQVIIATSCFANGNTDIACYAQANIIGNTCYSTTGNNIYLNSANGGAVAENTLTSNFTAIQLDTGASGFNLHDNVCSATTITVIATKSTNSDIHDNIILGGGGIVEQTGAQGNNIHDNTLIGGGTITKIGTATITRDNPGFNPRGHSVTQPAVPASTVAATNTTGCDCTVHVNGGTVTVIAIGGTATGATTGAFRVPVGQTIAITYSVAPTWQWFGD